MNRSTVEERIKIIQSYYKKDDSAVSTLRLYDQGRANSECYPIIFVEK